MKCDGPYNIADKNPITHTLVQKKHAINLEKKRILIAFLTGANKDEFVIVSVMPYPIKTHANVAQKNNDSIMSLF